MSFAIFKGETSVNDLVKRLFGIKSDSARGPGDPAVSALVDVLLNANPDLNDISKLQPGYVITIPATAPPVVAAEKAVAPSPRRVAAAEQAQRLLSTLNQRLGDIEVRAAHNSSALLAAAKSKLMQQAAQIYPDVKQQLPALIESIQTSLLQLPTNKTSRSASSDEIQKALVSFAQRR